MPSHYVDKKRNYKIIENYRKHDNSNINGRKPMCF